MNFTDLVLIYALNNTAHTAVFTTSHQMVKDAGDVCAIELTVPGFNPEKVILTSPEFWTGDLDIINLSLTHELGHIVNGHLDRYVALGVTGLYVNMADEIEADAYALASMDITKKIDKVQSLLRMFWKKDRSLIVNIITVAFHSKRLIKA